MATRAIKPPEGGVSPYVVSLSEDLRTGAGRSVRRFALGALEVEIRAMSDSVWALVRREGKGGLALRAAYLTGSFTCTSGPTSGDEVATIEVTSAVGTHRIVFRASDAALENLRMTVIFKPADATLIPYQPRDLYPLDKSDDPLGAGGKIEATQTDLNVAMVYFRLDNPAFGNVLYLQNLTALNPYYEATGTVPNNSVGGAWPELGHLLPTAPQAGAPAQMPLAAGVEFTLSDAILVIRHEAPTHERESARQFLQMLGIAYNNIERPPVRYRDWVARAEWTLRDLDSAPEATIRHYGHRYVHPYTAAEYPDIMVQLSLATAIHDWGKWSGHPHPLEAEFKAGLGKFYDPALKSLRRYLPNVGDDKDADAMDSWYLYHPMLNLGNLALDGDTQARKLLMDSIDYGIKAAHHFKYKWPVQYKITDFSIITEKAEVDGRGQTDVGGIYAWVMLQAFELTDDKRYLDEARAAIDAAMGLRFDVNYQANLTAWGAAACMRLWRITNQQVYLEQSYVYLASFFHHCEIWESEIQNARHYSNFMAVTCLQDAPYMAIYECFDSFAAFERYLDDSGPELEPAARLLVAEYCKYALYRAWFYYPDALPPEVLSPEQRPTNGHIDRKLSFPVEDLYPDGQLAGQVGQEIYGAGAAFIFATRAFHQVEGAPFRVYCDHLVRVMERTGDTTLSITLDGGETSTAGVCIVRAKRRKLKQVKVRTVTGEEIAPHFTSADRIDFVVPASGRVLLTWE